VYYQSRSIIIKSMDYRESDKLVTVFSEKEGKLGAIARGIKKPGSSLRASVQPFCHSLLFFHRGRGLDLVTQGKLLDFYGNSREDIKRTLYCIYLMELLDKALMDRVPMVQLYKLVLAVLEYINNNGLNPLVLRFFEMQLLIQLGYRPVLDRCISCNRQGRDLQTFSPATGGILCRECANGKDDCLSLSGEVLGLLRLMITGNLNTLPRVRASDAALDRLEFILERYLEYHLERRFNLKNTIRILKKTLP
jgi:DNA repair protein RecO (recombination protein O)